MTNKVNKITTKAPRVFAEPKFHLTNSRLKKINIVVNAYLVKKGPVNGEIMANELGQGRAKFSMTHNFLKDIGILDRNKNLTEKGRELATVLKFGTDNEIKKCWQEIIINNKFCIDLLNDINSFGGVNREMIRNRIFLLAVYDNPPKDVSIGANALVDIFILAEFISKTGKNFTVSDTFMKMQSKGQLPQASKEKLFISESHIKELEAIHNEKFDLTRLKKYCQEINDNFFRENYSSVAFLCRAILDHCPPIFEEQNFESIPAHTRKDSLKKAANHLDHALVNIVGHHLHKHISEKEVLPVFEEIDFASEMNFLIGRIIERLAKK